jgi:hypothetical protein
LGAWLRRLSSRAGAAGPIIVDMTLECDQGSQAAAYVLGELEGAELAAFKLHLRRCPTCAEEVELLESAAHAVPLLATPQAPRDPPPISDRTDVEARLQEALHKRPQLRAIMGGAAEDAGRESGAPPPHKRRKRRIPTQVTIAVAGLLVVALMAAILTRESNSINYIRAEAGWDAGGAVVKVQGTQAELLVEGMPPPPRGKFYEVWLRYKHSSALTPTTARVRLNVSDEAGVGIPADIDKTVALAVYEEPLHGPLSTKSGAVIVADLRPLTEPGSVTRTVT